ncbi:MAG: M28 family peptidase [Candidatus Bathyarchaeia archaeon]
MIQDVLQQVSADRIRRDLRYLCRDPLPFRKVNYTRPGQSIDSLTEADAYIRARLESAGYEVTSTAYRAQPYRCDSSKPLHHWYSMPQQGDPTFDVVNLEATYPGYIRPEEIIQLVSHKDSASWIDSPGAHDNAVGTVANLELARVLVTCDLRRSVRLLFCNEEHTPWTSRFAAEAAAARGDRIIAVLNVDSLDGKSDEDIAAGRMTHAVGYSTDEGRGLAELIAACAARYSIGLDVGVYFKERVNDDDGMFINAGFRTTVVNGGSWPYADSEYHLPGDVFERVNVENVVRSTQLLLAAILDIDSLEQNLF